MSREADEDSIDMTQSRSFFPTLRGAVVAGVVVSGLLLSSARAQQPADPTQTPVSQQTTTDGKVTTTTKTTTDANGKPQQSVTSTMVFHRGKKKEEKPEKAVMTKDTRKAVAKHKKADALAGVDSKLPDKQLYDKAVGAIAKGHYDIARLDLQTMLNTYPNSEYQMRAKLAVADSWYKEGGTAALTQAESEYADFRVFFPNVPEAAEAQMRIGDIYFRQMDRPDRDYAKALHAEEEYRRMLTDYPDSVLVPQARQRLRDVQEVLATREAEIAAYYATRDNYAAVIARYQTVSDQYPLYSHMDDVLIGLGDSFEAQARFVRNLQNLPEGAKAKLEQLYDGEAADSYRRVVLEHSAAPHVDDAKDRLMAMNLPVPTPTKEQVAASVALENSRSTYRIADRAKLLFLRTPDVVVAAHIGDPTLVDPKATYAPTVVKKSNTDFAAALAPELAAPAPVASPVAEPAAPLTVAEPAKPAAPLAFEEVPTSGTAVDARTGSSVMSAPATTSGAGLKTGLSVEIITHAPGSTPADEKSNPLKAVRPTTSTDLPAVEKAGAAPDVPNEVTGATTPGQQPAANGKNRKPVLDKADESSSKTKKKKGIAKINPF